MSKGPDVGLWSGTRTGKKDTLRGETLWSRPSRVARPHGKELSTVGIGVDSETKVGKNGSLLIIHKYVHLMTGYVLY